jgi:hypothetical protein
MVGNRRRTNGNVFPLVTSSNEAMDGGATGDGDDAECISAAQAMLVPNTRGQNRIQRPNPASMSLAAAFSRPSSVSPEYTWAVTFALVVAMKCLRRGRAPE